MNRPRTALRAAFVAAALAGGCDSARSSQRDPIVERIVVGGDEPSPSATPSPPSSAPNEASERLAGDHRSATQGNPGLGTLQAPSAARSSTPAEAPPSRTMQARLSTFSTDVDTASYGTVRRALVEGRAPDPASVRIEEMLNYFDYDYPEPSSGETIALRAEVGECPWDRDHRLLHVGIRAREIAAMRAPARNIVLLLDVSGSMASPDKLPLVQEGFERFVRTLGSRDRVAIVVYSGSEGLALRSTPGDRTETIVSAIRSLTASGSTNGGAGIALAYAEARRGFIQGGVNRVVLATDGDFNVGITDRSELVALIERERASGVFLTALGVGQGNFRDDVMESLADHGNGNYAYLDSIDEATNVLIRESGSTLATVAEDVKVQVEMNPAMVASYRLVGYEDRAMTTAQFHDESADAGELGAGDSVTALYEITPTAGSPAVDDSFLGSWLSGPPSSNEELASIAVRFRDLRTGTTREVVVRPGATPRSIDRASDDFRFAASVAELGLLLRHSPYAAGASYASARSLASGAIGSDPQGHKAELVRLVDLAASLARGTDDWSASREPGLRYPGTIAY